MDDSSNNQNVRNGKSDKVMIDPTTINQNHYGYPTPSVNDDVIEKLQNDLISQQNDEVRSMNQVEGISQNENNKNDKDKTLIKNKKEKNEEADVIGTSKTVGESGFYDTEAECAVGNGHSTPQHGQIEEEIITVKKTPEKPHPSTVTKGKITKGIIEKPTRVSLLWTWIHNNCLRPFISVL